MYASPATLLSLLLLLPATALAAGGRQHIGSSFSKRQNGKGGNTGNKNGGNQNGNNGNNGGGGNAQTSLSECTDAD